MKTMPRKAMLLGVPTGVGREVVGMAQAKVGATVQPHQNEHRELPTIGVTRLMGERRKRMLWPQMALAGVQAKHKKKLPLLTIALLNRMGLGLFLRGSHCILESGWHETGCSGPSIQVCSSAFHCLNHRLTVLTDQDPRVASVLTWIQHVQVPLAMFGVRAFFSRRTLTDN